MTDYKLAGYVLIGGCLFCKVYVIRIMAFKWLMPFNHIKTSKVVTQIKSKTNFSELYWCLVFT